MLEPAGTETGAESPDILKPVPETVAWEIERVALPVLEILMVWLAEVCTVKLPKLTEEGMTLIIGTGAAFTVNVAALLEAEPAELVTTTVKVKPLSEVVVAGVV